MKKIIIGLTILSFTINLNAQSNISSLINRLQSVEATQVETMQNMATVFENSTKDEAKKTWLHNYYTAYCLLQVANNTPNLDLVPKLQKKVDSLLKIDERTAAQLLRNGNGPLQEINCLKAMSAAVSMRLNKDEVKQKKLLNDITQLLESKELGSNKTPRATYVRTIAMINNAAKTEESKLKIKESIKITLEDLKNSKESEAQREEELAKAKQNTDFPKWGIKEIEDLLLTLK